MSDTGWILGSLARNIDHGYGDWMLPDHAKINDGDYSYTTIYTPTCSDELNVYSFSPGIPAGQQIDGIAFRIERYASHTDVVTDYTIHLMQGTNTKGNNKASADTWPSNSTEKDYGGATDLWGTTWTAAEANGIGLAVRVQAVDGTETACVDYMSAKIWYSPIPHNSHLMIMGM